MSKPSRRMIERKRAARVTAIKNAVLVTVIGLPLAIGVGGILAAITYCAAASI